MRVLVIAAHPDDETVGAGMLLRRLARAGADVSIVHVTDGAPRDLRDARAAGFDGWQAYTRARRDELAAALAAGGLHSSHCECLGIPDQQASRELVPLTRRIGSMLSRFQPDAVLTHPYEGGHPDHDATAFAVAVASRFVPSDVFELSSYHFVAGALRTTTFLPACGSPPVTVTLTAEERAVKARMIRCFATQQRVLRQFPIEAEAIRRAPAYDFTQPPHAGRLFYEHFDWGLDGRSWCEHARAALRILFGDDPGLCTGRVRL